MRHEEFVIIGSNRVSSSFFYSPSRKPLAACSTTSGKVTSSIRFDCFPLLLQRQFFYVRIEICLPGALVFMSEELWEDWLEIRGVIEVFFIAD
ncbi:hypothetical protein AVEN_217338-1 [Araneus ventricosus]|uniref:Uncharacterized protein n=1 Tax=Araneus ventricosus TaxID=182803 RepID=A0A4Y2JU51_ARAVE|nr:hypothetical protein AVEN_217338-1 [Araneus ventricosus]